MDDQQKSISILLISCVLFFILGFCIGIFADTKIDQSLEKQRLELNIELTKLKIKELKAANHE